MDAGGRLRRALHPDARLDRGRAGAAEHPPRPRRQRRGAAVGDELLPADDRGPGRHRRAPRRHVRPQARLPDRDRRLRPRLDPRRRRPEPDDADRRPGPAGSRGGPDPDPLAGDRLQRLPVRGTAAGARDLGRDLGDRARGRAAGRRRADRNRLAGDLLDQPADHRRRGRDHVGGGAGVDRPLGRPPDRPPGPGRADGRADRGRPRPDPVARVGRRDGRRPRRGRGARPDRLLADRASRQRPDRRIRPLPQRALFRRQRRRLRDRRLLLGADVLPAPVPAGRASATRRSRPAS